ncbi:MAG: response regulator transcription factor [Chloroflexi bacterium]|nr:MAG: response regulator transcription factor [Chloroflexota bacterium]
MGMSVEAQIRVLIVEDHTMFAQALQSALDATDDIAVLAVAPSAADGLAAARTTPPDIVLMDYRLPDGDGVETARLLKKEHPETKVVMLTATGSDEVFRKAISAGCSGYLTKDQNIDQLMLAVRAAYRGDALISPEMLSRLVGRGADRTQPGHDLTTREIEVLKLVAEGLSNAAIAKKLGIRLATVRNHVQSLISKLYAHSKLEAVATAVRGGIIRYGE